MRDIGQTSGQLLTQTLREALDSVVAPDVRDEILKVALRESGRVHPPSERLDFMEFVHGPIHSSISRLVGRASARIAVEEFSRLVCRHDDNFTDTSDVRTKSDLTALQTGSGSAGKRPHATKHTLRNQKLIPPQVLIATADQQSAKTLAARLQDHATVQAVEDVMTLLDTIQAGRKQQLAVIVDGQLPTVSIATLAALAPDFPEKAQIFLWRADEGTKEQACAISHRSKDWQTVPDSADSMAELAQLCIKAFS